jgi:hypothetical protein
MLGVEGDGHRFPPYVIFRGEANGRIDRLGLTSIFGPYHDGNETGYCGFGLPPGNGSSWLHLETPSDGRRNQQTVQG